MTDATITSAAQTVVAEVKAEVTKAKAFENKVFAFVQAHYTKGAAFAVGFAASHFGVIGTVYKLL